MDLPVYRRYSRNDFLYRACLIGFLVGVAVLLAMVCGCTLAQSERGLDTVSKLQAATTQPYVTIPAEAAGPWGVVALSAANVLLGGLSLFFKSQRDQAQAHLDTVKVATGTKNNAEATAAAVNFLDTTPVTPPVTPPQPK